MMTSTDYGWSPKSRYGAFVGDAFMGRHFVWMKQALNAAQSFTQTYNASSVVGVMVGFRFLLQHSFYSQFLLLLDNLSHQNMIGQAQFGLVLPCYWAMEYKWWA